MSALVTLTTAALSITSLQIAVLVEARHDSVKRTIERLVESGVIVQPPLVDEPGTDVMGRFRPTQVYVFSDAQGKRDSIVVVAQLSPEFTARLVDRWQELEAKAAQPFAIPKTLPDALRLAADLADKVDVLEQTVSAQTDAIAQQRPAVEFVDRFVNAEGLYGLQNAGRALGLNPNKFVRELKNRGYLFHQGRALVPYERHRAKGIFEVKVTDCNGDARMQTFVTPKGLTYFAPLFNAALQGSLVAAGGVH